MKKISIEDIFLFVGIALLGAGLWLVQPWISLTVVGGALMMIGGMPLITATVRGLRNGTGNTAGRED